MAVGILILVAQLLTLALLIALEYLLLRPLINGAVYFPTSETSVQTMLRLANIKRGEKVVDLGSGDGRILLAFARAGGEAHGYEINPILVWRSRRAIREAGLEGKTFVHWKSFWRADLSPFDVVIVYGIPYIMKKLEGKLGKELKTGARVLSNVYPFPGRRPTAEEKDGKAAICLYVQKDLTGETQ